MTNVLHDVCVQVCVCACQWLIRQKVHVSLKSLKLSRTMLKIMYVCMCVTYKKNGTRFSYFSSCFLYICGRSMCAILVFFCLILLVFFFFVFHSCKIKCLCIYTPCRKIWHGKQSTHHNFHVWWKCQVSTSLSDTSTPTHAIDKPSQHPRNGYHLEETRRKIKMIYMNRKHEIIYL